MRRLARIIKKCTYVFDTIGGMEGLPGMHKMQAERGVLLVQ